MTIVMTTTTTMMVIANDVAKQNSWNHVLFVTEVTYFLLF
jgi:hypothetical protein